MKLIVFNADEETRLGICTDDGVVDVKLAGDALAGALGGVQLPSSVDDFYASGLDYLPALKQLAVAADDQEGGNWLFREGELDVAAIVPNPGKVVCVGLNYRQHAIEAGMAIPQTPVLFSKYNNTIAAPGEVVPLPPDIAIKYDYESELVVVMGKRARNVSEEDALEYVLGYCNGNDVSARDLQMQTGQWLLGKTLDKFMPIGPYLVTSDELTDPQKLQIRGWYNGELRQDSNTSDMIFSVRECISYISKIFTLEAGDIISTGTPQGVILGFENPEWMKPGDSYVVEVEGLGRLENRMG